MTTGPAHVPYGSHRERLDLAQVLPLAQPLALLVDPSNACNFRCFFCPTGSPDLLRTVGRPKGQMPFALFEKIVADCAAFPAPLKSLHLYKDGEPLVHKRFPDMVRLAKQRGIARYVETTSNGALLTPALAEALVDAGLDGLRISVYGTDDAEYRAVTRGVAGYQTVLDNVRTLHRIKTARGAALHIHCKILNTDRGTEGRRRFLDDFTPISDSLYVHPLHGEALALPGFDKTPDAKRVVCSEPFIKLAINFDGRVSACCADWSLAAVVGDVTRDSLTEIWHGPALHQFRMTHLAGRRDSLPACRGCSYVQTLPADNNLDHAAPTLAARYAVR